MAFDHDFRARGYVEIVGLALDDLDGFAVKGTQERSFIHLGRNGHPADHRHAGIAALHDGERHRFTDLSHSAQIIPMCCWGKNRPVMWRLSSVMIREIDQLVHRPSGVRATMIPPGVEVAAAIVLVDLRNRKPIQRRVCAAQNVLLAGS